MAASATVSRAQLVYGLCLPLAALIGFFLADPLKFSSMAVMVGILGVLFWPLFIKWYHPMLVGSIHATFYLGFLPGAVPLWYPMAFAAFLLVVINRCLDARVRLIPEGGEGVVWAILALAIVVGFTGVLRGGAGLAALGGTSSGGKKYAGVLLSLAVYFVIVSRAVPPSRAMVYVGLISLTAFTGLLSHVAFSTNQFWLFRFVDPSSAIGQAAAQWDVQGQALFRSPALMGCMTAVIFFMAARYGAAGLLRLKKPWRLLLVLGCTAIGMLAGFRIFLAEVGLLLLALFVIEGLHRTRYVALVAALLAGGVLLAVVCADDLPRSVQRSLSFLPIRVDPTVLQDAQVSIDWRVEMWDLLRKEVPRFLALGKGFGIDQAAVQFSEFNSRFGFSMRAEWAVLTGEYHNGPLGVLIPLGIPGAAAFAWLLVASFRRLVWFCRHGDPELRRINNILLAGFIARTLVFLFLFGSFHSQLVSFIIFIALAESFNWKPAPPEEETDAAGATAWEGGRA